MNTTTTTTAHTPVTRELAQAEMAALKQEIGRAFAPILMWYAPPPGKEPNLRFGEAAHATMIGTFRYFEPRFIAAKAALHATTPDQDNTRETRT